MNTDHRLQRRAVAGLAATVLALVAGCTAASRSPGPQASFRDCTVAGQQGRCTTVPVPQDWSRPDGPTLGLRVLVLPARTGTPTDDPLVYLTGGPGGAATSDADVSWATVAFRFLHETRDLVFVDQRGTGGSAAQTCPAAVDDERLPADQLTAQVRACLTAAPRDPRHDTTPAAARDLEAVRTALHYGKLNLYGISYGVSLGLAYLQRYDAHVRTALLDSGSLLDVPLWQRTPTSAQHAFDQLAARCAADAGCAARYAPAADLATVVAALRAQPVAVTAGGQTGTIDLPGFLGSVIDDYLADPQTAVLLPADLHDVAASRWATVAERRAGSSASSSEQPISMMRLTVMCGDAWAQMDPAAVNAQTGSAFTPLTAARAAWQQAVCPVWPHDAGAKGTVRTDVPVIFVNGTADPTDPPELVADAPRTMPNALLVAVAGGGHGTLDPGCLQAAAGSFIENGRVVDAESWTTCAAGFAAQLPAFPPAP